MRKSFPIILATAATISLFIGFSADAGDTDLIGKIKSFFTIELSPRDVLTAYLKAKQKGDFKTAYSLLSSEDQSVRPQEQFVASESEGYAAFKGFAALVDPTVTEITSGDKRVTATIVKKHPDPKAILGTVFAATAGDKEGAEKAIADRLATGDFPMTTTTSKKVLIKEENEWRVYEGYKLKDRIVSLMAEAKRLEAANRYDGAVRAYNELLTLKIDFASASDDYSRESVVAKRESIVAKREAAKEKAAQAKASATYISNIKLFDFKSGYHETNLEKHVPGVTFKLKNDGDKTVKTVEVTVFFKDAKGNTISEETYYPVNSSSIFEDKKPLKPGYIWQIERGKFYSAKSVPTEWAEGSAFAKITKIEIDE